VRERDARVDSTWEGSLPSPTEARHPEAEEYMLGSMTFRATQIRPSGAETAGLGWGADVAGTRISGILVRKHHATRRPVWPVSKLLADSLVDRDLAVSVW